jgi:2-polyprenyl-3-methyl-5-hydroxy-6-metoxy-1,4-benzoquinol methylase
MGWDDEAASWDEQPAVRRYAELASGSLRTVLASRGKPLRDTTVLDFGCGTGLLTARMAQEAPRVVGLDLSSAMIDRLNAKALPNVVGHAGSLDSALADGRLAPGTFDLITCSSVCAFVPDYPHTVAQLVTLLSPGGVFVQWDWELDPGAEEPMGLSREAIREALTGAGLAEVTVDVGFRAEFEGFVMAPVMGTGCRG